MSHGATADIDPKSWSIEDGKRYLNLNEKYDKVWFEDLSKNIKKADKNWPAALEK